MKRIIAASSRRLIVSLCITLCVPFGAGSALAVPACPDPIDIRQPDGTALRAFIRGDERRGWIETASGYTIMENRATGEWQYAVRTAGGGLALSGIAARPGAAPPAGVRPHLMPAARDIGLRRPASSAVTPFGPRFGSWPPQPVSGSKKLLVVLVEFQDQSLATTAADWSDSIFSTDPGVKSVANFYDDNSFGSMGLVPVTHTQTDPGSGLPLPAGITWATLSGIDHPDCGGELDYGVEATWVNAALDIVDDYVDFPALDTNPNGVLTPSEAVVYFILAGYEASGTSKHPNIWAHAWGGPGVSAGGIQVPEWALNGELNYADAQQPMGAIAHELGHSMCGLPDLYDTTYTNSGLGAYSLMASGSWGRTAAEPYSGTTPVSLDAWSRRYVGWATPRTPTPGELSFGPALSSADAPVEMVNAAVSTDQYFLVENRYPTGWDEGMERYLGADWGGGLLIIHIDEAIGTPIANDINEYGAGPHQGVIPDEASVASGSVLDPYPGTRGHVTHLFYLGNNSQFDDATTPNSNLYSGTPTYLGLKDISARAETMTATFYMSSIVATPTFDPDGGVSTSALDVTVTCATPDATIHYTTDGVDPAETDPTVVSGGTVNVAVSMTLKAKAWRSGWTASEVKSAVFTIRDPIVIYVKTDGDNGNSGLSWAAAKQTVQGGIDSAIPGDEVWAKAGTYVENITLADGVAVYGGFAGTETQRGRRAPSANETVLDGGASGSVVAAPPGVGPTAVVSGFTIQNGSAGSGGGVYCSNSSPTISDNTIVNNAGGVYCNGGSAVLKNNIIAANTSADDGAGIRCDNSSPTITNCTITDNASDQHGGGIYCYDSAATIVNNIIAFNSSGIYRFGTAPTLCDNCVYGNTVYDYSGLSPGPGDIQVPPLFVDRPGGNYHLQPDSPCIDAGDDTVVEASDRDMDRRPRIEGGHADIGADEHRRARFDTGPDGSDDLIGLSYGGAIWYTTDKSSWTSVPGHLSSLAVGDLNGDGSDDIAGLSTDDSIWYTTDMTSWTNVPGRLSSLALGDLDGDGSDDVAGLSSNGSIWYTADKSTWTKVPGYLSGLIVGDFDCDGRDDLAGLGGNGSIWYTVDKAGWSQVPGCLSSLAAGDLDADGYDDLAGLGTGGAIWYTTDMAAWSAVPGYLASLVVGDFDGDGEDDLAGLSASDGIWYTTNKLTWTNVPGFLSCLVVGDLDGDGEDDLAGLSYNGSIWYTTDKTGWTNVPGTLLSISSAR